MSQLQLEVVQSLEGLSDENLLFLLEMINRFMKSDISNVSVQNTDDNSRIIGMFENEKLYADGYDFDEDNDEIAKMFGV